MKLDLYIVILIGVGAFLLGFFIGWLQKKIEQRRTRKASGQGVKAGRFAVVVEKEPWLWHDRKRWALFGLPWTFTSYILTETQLKIQKGFWNKTEDNILLYRISDVTMFRSLGERLNGTGTLCVMSSDSSSPEVHLKHIKHTEKVKELLMAKIQIARKENGIHASELVGLKPGIEPISTPNDNVHK